VTYLSRRLMCWAFFPSMYRVLGFPGRSRITPSNTVPKLGEETETPCAYGIALSMHSVETAWSGSRELPWSAWHLWQTLHPLRFRIFKTEWRGVQTRTLGCLCMISLGLTDGGGGLRLKREGNSGEPCSGGGVGGYWMREEP
jgi:hypothetical protein